MGKTLKIIVCGKKAVGKTSLLEQLVYNNSNLQQKYFPTIEDIYIACWEKDKGVKEKIRFYDTKGLENSKDLETINQMRHLFPYIDGVCLVYSSNDPDSIKCIELLKSEIDKTNRDRKVICNFILIDNQTQTPINQTNPSTENKDLIKSDIQNRLKIQLYEIQSLDKRDQVCKPFIDLAQFITQTYTKGSITIKKPKVFSSSKQ